MNNVLYEEITRLQKIDKAYDSAIDYIATYLQCPHVAGHDPKWLACNDFPDCGEKGNEIDCWKKWFEKEGI